MIGRRKFLKRSVAAVAGIAANSALARAMASATSPTTASTQSTTMLTRTIPSTGQSIPVIGLGTWQTFDPPNLDEASLAPLQDVLKLFHESGGRVIDSSPMYGKAEEVTGLLSSRLGISDDLFIATKVWTRGEAAGVEQMKSSLAKLKREKLELMQVHNLVDWQAHLKTLRKWKDAGTFRYIGITHYARTAFDDLERIMKTEALDFIQLPYSLGNRDAEQRLLPTARDRGVAVLVMRPFEEGNLFARTKGKLLPNEVKRYADSWASAFLKFILAHPAVTCVIPATSKVEHLKDNLAAGVGRLPDAKEREALVRLVG